MNEIITLRKWLSESKNIVFFGGAGVSTESGIPDFRSADGLYSRKFDYPPEYMLSSDFFINHTAEFFDFYRSTMIVNGAEPNDAHKKLAMLSSQGKLTAVITQNIDGLHQDAGPQTVLELHGSVKRNYCTKCKRFYPLEFIMSSSGVPQCECGGIVKPDVVLYGEQLPAEVFIEAERAIRQADLLIIGGTSLTVYPAAGLVDLYHGDKLVLINKSQTKLDSVANLVITAPVGQTFAKVFEQY